MKKLLILLLLPGYVLCQTQEIIIYSSTDMILNQVDIFGKNIGFPLQTNSLISNSQSQKYSFHKVLSQPGMFYIFDLSNNSFPYFFAFPGDTILIDFNDSSTQTTGKHKSEYNVLQKLSVSKANLLFNSEGGEKSIFNDFEGAYTNANRIFRLRNTMIRQHEHEVRKEYSNILYNVNRLKRLDFLLTPYNSCSPVANFIPANRPRDYFAEIDSMILWLNKLDSEQIVSTYSFWISKILINYSNYVARNGGDLKFERKFKSASIFSSQLRDIYLTNIMLDNGNNESVRQKYLTTFLLACTQDSLRKKVLEMSEYTQRITNDSLILNTILVENNLKQRSWQDIYQSGMGRVVYIDFWASWCAGCKVNIPKIDAMKQRFPDLEVIFISKDASKDRWIRAIKSWKIGGLGKHYIIDPQSELAKILTEPTIPRGALIDKTGKIVTIDTDYPDSERLNERIKSLMDEK